LPTNDRIGEYVDWEAIETEVKPKFKEAVVDFRDQKHSFVCPRKDELEEDLQESFPLLDEMSETEEVASNRNPKEEMWSDGSRT
jgi:hypothetical protein